MRKAQREQGYQEIKTPQLVDMSLWQRSGHADKFGDDMFILKAEERDYAVKPMNCSSSTSGSKLILIWIAARPAADRVDRRKRRRSISIIPYCQVINSQAARDARLISRIAANWSLLCLRWASRESIGDGAGATGRRSSRR